MPETRKIVCLVNSCIYYAHQTRESYHVLPYSVDFKVSREILNPLERRHLVNVVLFGIKDL